MTVSKQYGPQFDASDGTIGELQLVLRYVLVSGEDASMWTSRQGRYTHATLKEASDAAALYKASNAPDREPSDLRPAPWWCYPGHFDPCGPASKES